ncbi:MAG: tetratricopeptide repeat protein, partial [Maricaulaceae bacterium]
EYQDGAFTRRELPSLAGVESLAFGDVDRDGKVDLVMASPEEEAVAWCSGAQPIDTFPQQLPSVDKPVAVAVAPDGGTKKMRADFYAEAANFWLLGNLPKEAYASATAGLKLRKDHVGLRVARARAYALLGRFDYAEIDLTSALVYAPENVDALRYRADARRNIGNLQDAKDDIDKAISLDYTSFETAVVRGEILEALRAQDAEKTDTDTE